MNKKSITFLKVNKNTPLDININLNNINNDKFNYLNI
jgi:hypothetical protein